MTSGACGGVEMKFVVDGGQASETLQEVSGTSRSEGQARVST